MRKILIIRFSSIGDIVLTTPVIRCLKLQKPDIEIHYCTKKSFALILENNPYLNKVYYLEESIGELIQLLKKEKYDHVIDLHKNLRSFMIRSSLGIPSSHFDKLNVRKWLYVNFRINTLPEMHIVDRYMATVKKFGVKNDGLGLDYFIPSEQEVKQEQLPKNFHHGYVAFIIGAQHNTKKLPPDKIIEFCEKLNQPVILIGGADESEAGKYVENYFISKYKSFDVYNACGKYNLHQSASIIRQAQQVLSHDTGFMHIAAAFKKEIISIWGNTTPHFGMYPYLTSYRVIENNHLSCRPCSKIGYDKCPQGHFKCMKDLTL
jgi:ADP-heptose:LPS heptosyltransferase